MVIFKKVTSGLKDVFGYLGLALNAKKIELLVISKKSILGF